MVKGLVMIITAGIIFCLSGVNVAIYAHDSTNYLNVASAVWLFGLGIIATKLIGK
jgi:hypothetical protein